MKVILITILLGVSFLVQAQQPVSECRGCEKLNSILNSQSPHLRFGTISTENNDVYLYAEDDEWLRRSLGRWWSGISIEYVTVSDSFCIPASGQKINYYQNFNHSRRKLRRRMVYDTVRGIAFIPMEVVPQHLQEEKYDINIIFTHKNRNCRRYVFYPVYNSNYRLSLNYTQDPEKAKIKFIQGLEGEQEPIRDTFNYFSQFEQNQSIAKYIYAEFFKDSIGDMSYFLHMENGDSVQIKDIKNIEIDAYASIEGESDENLELARNRAYYLREIFSSWGVDTSRINISYKENWELYGKQINTAKYSGLKKYSSKHVKDILNDTAAQKRIEDLLIEQRQSYITIYTEKLHPVQLLSNSALKDSLNYSLKSNDFKMARICRYEFYKRIVEGRIADSELSGIAIADTFGFLDVHNYFKHLLNPQTQNYSLWMINALLKGNNKDGELQFYRLSKKAKNFDLAEERKSRFKIKREIKNLGRLGVPSIQVNRILVNYHFTLAEKYRENLNFRTKARTLKAAYKLVKRMELTMEEDLAVAKFFDHMVERELAIKNIQEYIDKNTYDEEVLFTYLFLTLPFLEKYKENSYMLLVERAREMNKERFMAFFDPSVNGSTAISLLEDDSMVDIYCGSK